MGIFLADEGLDVGVEDLGVVAVDLEAPAGGRTEVCVTPGGKGALGARRQASVYLRWESWRHGGTSLAG